MAAHDDTAFGAIAMREPQPQQAVGHDHLAVDMPDSHYDDSVSLDVAGDVEVALTAEEGAALAEIQKRTKASMASALAAKQQSSTSSTTASAIAKETKQQQRYKDAQQSAAKTYSSAPSSHNPIRRKERIINTVFCLVFGLTALVAWGVMPIKWVRLRENAPTPQIEADNAPEDNLVFHITYTSYGGMPIILGYLPLTILIASTVYFATCIVPHCGPRLLPWNWHNEDVYWKNWQMGTNPTYWIWYGWSTAVGSMLAGILCMIHDQWILVCVGGLAAGTAYLLGFTEAENEKSPNRSKDQRAFWLAAVLWLIKSIVLFRGFHLMHTATVVGGAEFHSPDWVVGGALVYLLPEIFHMLLTALRVHTCSCCCGLENYAKYVHWTRAVSGFAAWSASVAVLVGLSQL